MSFVISCSCLGFDMLDGGGRVVSLAIPCPCPECLMVG